MYAAQMALPRQELGLSDEELVQLPGMVVNPLPTDPPFAQDAQEDPRLTLRKEVQPLYIARANDVWNNRKVREVTERQHRKGGARAGHLCGRLRRCWDQSTIGPGGISGISRTFRGCKGTRRRRRICSTAHADRARRSRSSPCSRRRSRRHRSACRRSRL